MGNFLQKKKINAKVCLFLPKSCIGIVCGTLVWLVHSHLAEKQGFFGGEKIWGTCCFCWAGGTCTTSLAPFSRNLNPLERRWYTKPNISRTSSKQSWGTEFSAIQGMWKQMWVNKWYGWNKDRRPNFPQPSSPLGCYAISLVHNFAHAVKSSELWQGVGRVEIDSLSSLSATFLGYSTS